MSGNGSLTGFLAPRVLTELQRLHGLVPEKFELRKLTVNTPAGEYPVPPSVQALLAVTWPADQCLRRNDRTGIEWETRLYSGTGAETLPELVTEARAWYNVGDDEGQYLLLVDLAEAATTDDPLTYRIDHEGGQPTPDGVYLSDRLDTLRRSTAPIELGRACVWGDVQAVRAALQRGVSTGPLERYGLTPLHLATFSGSVEVVQALLDAGADPNAALAEDVDDSHVWDTYFENYHGRQTRIDPLCCVGGGDTPLHAAVHNLSIDYVDWVRPALPHMVRLMLASGADPNAGCCCETGLPELSPADIVFYTRRSSPGVPEINECRQLLQDAGARRHVH